MIPMNPRQVHGDKLLRQTVNYSTFKYILFKFSVIHKIVKISKFKFMVFPNLKVCVKYKV